MEKNQAVSLCQRYISENGKVVPEHESKGILQKYGVSTPVGAFVQTAEEAVRAAERLGYPVVLKAVSSKMLHKTELGGVFLNIVSAAEVKATVEQILAGFRNRNEELQGILVEEMVRSGAEFIVGIQDDPNFGPVIMLGSGGVLIDILDDVTFRMLPVDREEVRDMVEELKGKLFLKGYRGKSALNEEAFIEAVVNIGRLGIDAAGFYESMDFNPLVVTSEGAIAVDAKIVLPQNREICGISVAQPNTRNLDKFFAPQTVALIGASTTPDKIGYVVADSLINHDYAGKVYPITKGGREIFGLKSYENLSDLPEKIDLAVVVVGLPLVPDILKQCRDLQIPAVLIISGGGKELGGSTADLEKEIHRKAIEYGIRVIGPNCIGCFNAENRFDAFFQTHERMVRPGMGNIAFTTQSGTYGCSFLEEFEDVGVSKMISYGNRVDVDEADMITYLAQDPTTRALAAYVEGIGDGRKFIGAAREAILSSKKPIVLYKSGRTKRSALAAQSHTGAYGGTYGIYQGAFKQAGILAVDSYEELAAAAKALSLQNPAAGTGISMISNGAGPMVNAIDLFEKYGLEMAKPLPATIQKMEDHFPPFYICKNPVDVTGSATSDDYRFAMECLLEDPNVHVIMNWFVFQDTPLDEAIVPILDKINSVSEKPILCGAIGGPYTEKMSKAIEAVGVPVFRTAHTWIAAANALVGWGKVLRRNAPVAQSTK